VSSRKPTPPPVKRSPRRPARALASPESVSYGQGRERLVQAAARLAATLGHSRFSLRDLAKEAGMGHNSIYRHFQSMDDLVVATVTAFCDEVREGLSAARRSVPPGPGLTNAVMGWLLDFALAHRDVFVMAMRERHGPAGPAREAVENMLASIRQDMLAELTTLGHLPKAQPLSLAWAIEVLVNQNFQLSIDYIEDPGRRKDILERSQLLFTWVMAGAGVASPPGAHRPTQSR
jgi:TetR/AcrR family transcriptional regulator, fatty acid biosynthesis regulator